MLVPKKGVWFGTSTTRETIFDRVVSIPKELVLDIPKLLPLCDEIVGLKFFSLFYCTFLVYEMCLKNYQ